MFKKEHNKASYYPVRRVTQWKHKPFCSRDEGADDGIPGGLVICDCVAIF